LKQKGSEANEVEESKGKYQWWDTSQT